ncbi:MAG TPA: hypothetical protein VNZ61_06185 [Roseomonas sp.]|nr:hypothetical protein [Roseomonas sp.]
MADKKKSDYQPSTQQKAQGGNNKSSGKGGGKSQPGGAQDDMVGNARLRGEDPSPDNRKRGQTG